MQAIGRSGSKKDLVCKELKDAILRGELLPGTRLLIEVLASRLDVSPIPIREALQQLQADGYVVIEPYLGATVAPIEAESIEEVFQLLEIMETVSSVAACLHMTEDNFGELESVLVQMDSLVNDPEAWSRANKHFHQLICDRSGTRLVGTLISKVLDHLDRLQRYFLKDVFARLLPKAQDEHWLILRTLRKRDAVQIETLIKKHNRSCLNAFTRHLRELESRKAFVANRPNGSRNRSTGASAGKNGAKNQSSRSAQARVTTLRLSP
jgi:DNA-binding GntR family transcriptional regulator